MVTGDLVVWPTPFVFDSHIASWQASLDSLRRLGATSLIPGHGPVMRDFTYGDMVVAALRSLEQQTRAAKARGLDLTAARKTVDLVDLERRFVGDSKVRRLSWENYFVSPGVERAFEQADSTGPGR